MNVPEHFQGEWERYWKETSGLAGQGDEDGGSIWDAEAPQAAAQDVPRFQSFMNPELPLVDLGCGSGIQSRYLAQHFQRVIGADVSSSAVELAARENPAPNLQFRVLDVLNAQAVQAFREELGDVNIYIRTLLHLIQPEARPAFAASIGTLLGQRGTLYLYELGAAASAYFPAWIQRNGMPVRLQRVLKTGIKPGTVNREHVVAMFPPEKYRVLTDGEATGAPIPMRVLGPTPTVAAEAWAPPGYFMVLQPR